MNDLTHKKLILVVGGSGSGKSSYAEALFDGWTGARSYLATMRIYDEEGERRVERHRRNRAGKGFWTIACPTDIYNVCRQEVMDRKSDRTLDSDQENSDSEGAGAALLECMSNLVANEMFTEKGQKDADVVTEKICGEIRLLQKLFDPLVVVSNNVFEDGRSYDASTMEYLRALGQINQRLAAQADCVAEVVVGIPIMWKGKL